MNLNPQILHEDDSFLIVDKPAGLTVNKAATTKNQETLQGWIEQRLKVDTPDENLTDNEFLLRLGIVHRLDKETSGLMIIAKDEDSFINLQKQFKARLVEKIYIALTHGKIFPLEGEINVPLGRLPWDRKKFGVTADGKEAVTKYKLLEYKTLTMAKKDETLSLIELYPKTGRTHQIRVHLRYLGFPIFSDSVYGGRKNIRLDRKILPTHFLHAKNLKFIHPVTHQTMEFEARLPSELVNFLAILK